MRGLNPRIHRKNLFRWIAGSGPGMTKRGWWSHLNPSRLRWPASVPAISLRDARVPESVGWVSRFEVSPESAPRKRGAHADQTSKARRFRRVYSPRGHGAARLCPPQDRRPVMTRRHIISPTAACLRSPRPGRGHRASPRRSRDAPRRSRRRWRSRNRCLRSRSRVRRCWRNA
jgi:hypothetical protein